MNPNPQHDPHEQITEKLLTALGNAEPTPGLNDRILRTLHEQSGSRLQAASKQPRWTFALGLIATGVCAIAIVTMHKPAAVSSGPRVSHANRVTGGEPLASRVADTVGTSSAVGISLSRAPVSARPASNRPRHHRHAAPTLTAEDQLALDEMNAPSKPAPPLPLTAQERLLLRVAHRANPSQIAPLSPMRREIQDALEIAEFHAYFPQNLQEIPQ